MLKHWASVLKRILALLSLVIEVCHPSCVGSAKSTITDGGPNIVALKLPLNTVSPGRHLAISVAVGKIALVELSGPETVYILVEFIWLGPCGPIAPDSPGRPWAPSVPLIPSCPSCPSVPLKPCGSVAPVAPGGPCGPWVPVWLLVN